MKIITECEFKRIKKTIITHKIPDKIFFNLK